MSSWDVGDRFDDVMAVVDGVYSADPSRTSTDCGGGRDRQRAVRSRVMDDIRFLKERHGITQAQLARMLRVEAVVVCRWARGKQTPSDKYREWIAAIRRAVSNLVLLRGLEREAHIQSIWVRYVVGDYQAVLNLTAGFERYGFTEQSPTSQVLIRVYGALARWDASARMLDAARRETGAAGRTHLESARGTLNEACKASEEAEHSAGEVVALRAIAKSTLAGSCFRLAKLESEVGRNPAKAETLVKKMYSVMKEVTRLYPDDESFWYNRMNGPAWLKSKACCRDTYVGWRKALLLRMDKEQAEKAIWARLEGDPDLSFARDKIKEMKEEGDVD